MARYVARGTVKRMLKNGMDVPRCRIGVLGITFKENCPDIRNSKVADLVRELGAWGAQVVVADPWANAAEVAHEYGVQLGQVDADHPVDALVVAVGHNEFRSATMAELLSWCRGDHPVLADVKSLYDRHAAAAAGFTVFRL
jgi:UDP-N-acetyl-D-galactosamine dehydrogenase